MTLVENNINISINKKVRSDLGNWDWTNITKDKPASITMNHHLFYHIDLVVNQSILVRIKRGVDKDIK